MQDACFVGEVWRAPAARRKAFCLAPPAECASVHAEAGMKGMKAGGNPLFPGSGLRLLGLLGTGAAVCSFCLPR